MKILIKIIIFFFLIFPHENIKEKIIKKDYIGYIDTKLGSWVFYFITLPGKYGKPKTKIKTVKGKIKVYEIYDWAEHYKNLKGQKNHKWYRINKNKSYWVYGMSNFVYKGEK